MNRKVLTAGRSSLAVSLPRSFVNQHGLEPGMEIRIEHHGSVLEVSCDNPSPTMIRVSLKGFKTEGATDLRRFADKFLGALYKQGADRIIIDDCPPAFASQIRSILDAGKLDLFEEQTTKNDTLIIRCPVTQMDHKSLHGLIRSIIQQLYRSLELIGKWAKTGDEVHLKSVQEHDNIINRKADLCRRIIQQNLGSQLSVSHYTLVDKLEKIGDEIQHIAETCTNPTDELGKTLDQIGKAIFMMQQLFENYSFSQAAVFQAMLDDLSKKFSSASDNLYGLRRLVLLLDSTFSDLLMLSEADD